MGIKRKLSTLDYMRAVQSVRLFRPVDNLRTIRLFRQGHLVTVCFCDERGRLLVKMLLHVPRTMRKNTVVSRAIRGFNAIFTT